MQHVELAWIDKRNTTIAQPARPDGMKPEVAPTYAIYARPVINHAIVTVQREPGSPVGAIEMLKCEITNAAHQPPRFAIDDVIPTGWEWTNVGLIHSGWIVAPRPVAGKSSERTDAQTGKR